jgi:hypothetical protein
MHFIGAISEQLLSDDPRTAEARRMHRRRAGAPWRQTYRLHLPRIAPHLRAAASVRPVDVTLSPAPSPQSS